MILRGLLAGRRRYPELALGLPGIPSNLLSTRLRELEDDGLVVRELRAAAHGRIPRKTRSRVPVARAGEAVVHVTMHNGSRTVDAGEHTDPDWTIVAGPRFRDLLAGEIEPESAERAGAATRNGDSASLIDFCAAFRIPYADEHATRPPTQRPDR